MPEYLSPGVYVEEVDSGPKPIEGVSTSTSGMVGVTAWGPESIPTLITSFGEFRRFFGGYLDDDKYKNAWYLPHAVDGFFQNGGKRVYVVRILPARAKAAVTWLADTELPPPAPTTLNTRASSGGLAVELTNANAVAANDLFKLDDGPFTEYVEVESVAAPTVTLKRPLHYDHAQGAAFAKRTPMLKVQAIDRGEWGDSVRVTADDDESLLETTIASNASQNQSQVTLRTTNGAEEGTILEFYIQKLVDERSVVLTNPLGADADRGTRVRLKGTDWETTVSEPALAADTEITLESLDAVNKDDTLEFFTSGGPAPDFEWAVGSIHVKVTEALGADFAAGDTVYVRGARVVGELTADAVSASLEVNITAGAGVEAGEELIFVRFREKVASVNGKVVTIDDVLDSDVSAGWRVRSREFLLSEEYRTLNPLTGQRRTLDSETHRQLTMDPRHSRYIAKVIGRIPTEESPLRADGRTEGEGKFIRIEDGETDTDQQEKRLRLGPELVTGSGPYGIWLTGGDDDIRTLADRDYQGQDNVNPRKRTGIHSLRNVEEISIVAVPGRPSQPVQEALINHCELNRYRFAVVDSEPGDSIPEVQAHRGLYDTKYAALYYPWLKIPDPFPENPQTRGTVLIPPSGHMLGIYARSDIQRGVHKAPANEVIRGISDLEVKLMKEHQDILNPRNINVLRNFREMNRGLRVWGARVISSDPDWKYVNVRRLFIFIEHSIDRGTQWVVFEPNNEDLWARIRRVISAFLTNVWRDGALMGTTPEEAYFVKCDRTTMTQLDIDNGRLIVEIGIAPTKPAEFVIFRIGQWTADSPQE